MRFEAQVRRATGATAHFVGDVDRRGTFSADKAPVPETVEIREVDHGWLLIRIAANGEPITDTWHKSLEEAKAQARFEYEIDDADWELINPEQQSS